MYIFGHDKVLARIYSVDGVIAHQFLSTEHLHTIFDKNYVDRVAILCYSKKGFGKWILIRSISKFRVYRQAYHLRHNSVYGNYLHNSSFKVSAFKFSRYPTMYVPNDNKRDTLNSFLLSLAVTEKSIEYCLNITNKRKTYDISLEEYFNLRSREKIIVNSLKQNDIIIDYDFIYRNINDLIDDYIQSFIYMLDFLCYDDLFSNHDLMTNHLLSSPISIGSMLSDSKVISPMRLNWFLYLSYGYKYEVVSRIIHRNKKYENRAIKTYSEVSLSKDGRDCSKWMSRRIYGISYELILHDKKCKPVFFEGFNNIPFIREKYVGSNNSNKNRQED